MSAKDLFDGISTNDGVDNLRAALVVGEEIANVEERSEVMEQLPDGAILLSLEDGDAGKRVVPNLDAMKALDERASTPRDRRGSHTLIELKSLIAYVNRYKTADTLVWADISCFTVTAILNDHPANEATPDHLTAGWRNHRAVYACPRSAEWKAWTGIDQRALAQDSFADFIEEHLEDVRAIEGYPKPLELVTMARNLSVRTKGTFERSLDPTTGNHVLLNKSENDTGSTVIPRAFMLTIPVFENGAPYQVEARVRMAMDNGRATFAVHLYRRAEIERDAFNDVRKEIEDEATVPVLAGRP